MLTRRTIFFAFTFLLLFAIGFTNSAFAFNIHARVGPAITGGSGTGGSPSPSPSPSPAPAPADTTPPIISAIMVSAITTSSATISWTTDESSSTTVDYGTTATYGLTVLGAGGTTSHTVNLAGLTPSTSYHFRVRSTDASGNEAFSSDQTFSTATSADTTPPVLSSIQARDVAGDLATIQWSTDELADSRVDYGLTTSYEIGSVTSSTLVTSHSFRLSALSSQTTYHFRVRSQDQSGNASTSADFVFTTLDVTPPVISGVAVSDITSERARVSWTTDEPSTSVLTYTRQGGATLSSSDSSLVTSHTITLTGLASNSDYVVSIRARDAANNQSTAGTSFKTLSDRVPPANVGNLKADAGDRRVQLSWTNSPDVDFTGVRIQRGITGFPATPTDGENVFDGLATNFLDTNLTNGTTYHYTVFAYDASGNFASGALAEGTPEQAPVVPPGGEAAPPPVTQPAPGGGGQAPPATRTIGLENFNFFTAERAITLTPENSRIKLLPAASLGLTYDSNLQLGQIARTTLNLDNSTYLLRPDSRKFYLVDATAPSAPGVYSGAIKIDFTDGSISETRFEIEIVHRGKIFEKTLNASTPLAGAEVTLFVLGADGTWKTWNAAEFHEVNPLRTDARGEYGFLVPRGTYYLQARLSGYRDSTTEQLLVNNVIVNSDLELLKIPASFGEVVKSNEPFITNVAHVAKNVGEKIVFGTKVAQQEVVKFVKNPEVQRTTETIVTPGVAAVAAVNVVTAVSLANLSNYLYYLFTQPLLLLRRKKRVGWGTIYNAFTRVPIDLAIVRLYKAMSRSSFQPVASAMPSPTSSSSEVSQAGASPLDWRLVQTRVTDAGGRFIFIVEPGNYRIEVTKSAAIFPSQFLKEVREDDPYLNVYHGEVIKVEQTTELNPSIPLDPAEELLSIATVLKRELVHDLQSGVAALSVLLSALSFGIVRSPMTGGFLGLQVLVYLLFKRLARGKKPKGWGIIYDENTKQPLRHAIARIFETQFNKLLGTQVTDASGRYGFLAGKNAYYITFEKPGYEYKKSDPVDFSAKKQPDLIAPNIGLQPNHGSKS